MWKYVGMPQETLYGDPPSPENLLFIAVDFLNWQHVAALFRRAAEYFGAIYIVISNVGTMESWLS